MFGANRAPILCQDWHYLQTDWIKLPLEPRHLGEPLGASKTISEPMVRLAQTVHLSCTGNNTVSKRTETRFHMTHVTKEFHWVRPKQFLILGYIWCKPCTYLVSRLALSANGLNQASTWASSAMSSMMCIQNDFLSLWFVEPKPSTYHAPTLTLSPNGPKGDSTWSTSPMSSI
jgi:hypothetical protein